MVNEFLEVMNYPGVWAVGDCAAVPDKKANTTYPPTAQNAYRQGPLAARNILATIKGEDQKPFAYEMMGQLASIGHRTGVARIFGISFSGYIAWWLWRTIYLLKLPRFEKKLRVVMDWTLDIFFSKDLVQFLTRPSARHGHADDIPESTPAAPVKRPKKASKIDRVSGRTRSDGFFFPTDGRDVPSRACARAARRRCLRMSHEDDAGRAERSGDLRLCGIGL